MAARAGNGSEGGEMPSPCGCDLRVVTAHEHDDDAPDREDNFRENADVVAAVGMAI